MTFPKKKKTHNFNRLFSNVFPTKKRISHCYVRLAYLFVRLLELQEKSSA